ncbi:hypothetical protein [Arthrobacter roseus]|uniref:hypothetical protein n=1 Tax=Arthrobacter roseus TaxID=136274 RepID=UPI0019634771|nr:hypothetical protein [Arthrobacter roseus]MBM7847423.1 hypothetical protein [Arthrobacter roseus]
MKRLPVVLAIAALAVTGCQSGVTEPKSLLSPAESIDLYVPALDAVEDSLGNAYPDATMGGADVGPRLSLQDDGECVLFLPTRTIDLNLFLDNKEASMEALQAALNEHEFGDLTDVEQTGPVRSSHAEDARGAKFSASDRNSSEVSIRVPVRSETCGPDDLPAP